MVLFYVFIVLIPIVDFILKQWINKNIAYGEYICTIFPFLKITNVKNTGAAFSFFSGGRYFFIAIAILEILIFLYVIFVRKNKDKWFLLSSSFIIGGAIGNLVDRIFYGYVFDYLKLSFFSPVCNFSDYFITLGAVILIVSFLSKR